VHYFKFSRRLYNADETVNLNLEFFLGFLCVPVTMALMWDRHDTEVISSLRGKWWYLALSLLILSLLLVLLVGVTLIGLGYFWRVLSSPAQNKDTAVFKIEKANNPALGECADEVSAVDPENYCNVKEGEIIDLESGERSVLVKQDGQTVRYVYHMEGPKTGQVNYMEYKFYSKDGRPEARYISALELTEMQNVK